MGAPERAGSYGEAQQVDATGAGVGPRERGRARALIARWWWRERRCFAAAAGREERGGSRRIGMGLTSRTQWQRRQGWGCGRLLRLSSQTGRVVLPHRANSRGRSTARPAQAAMPPPPPAAAASAALRREDILRIATPLRPLLASAPYAPPEGSSTSVKSLLASLLPSPSQQPPAGKEAVDLLLFCAAARAASAEAPALHWVPEGLSRAAAGAMEQMAAAGGWGGAADMLLAMMPEAVPPLKALLKETDVDAEDDMISADKPPKEHAFVAAHQFRWLLSQVNYPKLGDLCWLVIPCALTALDHWSPDVKEQGMISFMHIAKNVKATELSLYEDAILDACCHNIPADDELWYRIVEVSVLLLTCTQRSNPRSPWYSRLLAEMLGHLERQPLNKERRVAWLTLIEPVFDAMGLFLLAHFRLLFSLFFQWIHADDDRTVLLVLERIHAVIKLTWIRKSPYVSRLVDELVLLYKESATRKSREIMRNHIVEILVLLQKCKGQLFEEAWKKHEADPDLAFLLSDLKELCAKDSSPEF